MTRALACLEAWLPGKPLISRMGLFLKATREVQPRVPTTRCHLGLSGSDANLSGRFLSSFACSSQDLHPLGLFTYLIGPSTHHVALESQQSRPVVPTWSRTSHLGNKFHALQKKSTPLPEGRHFLGHQRRGRWHVDLAAPAVESSGRTARNHFAGEGEHRVTPQRRRVLFELRATEQVSKHVGAITWSI